MFSDNKNRKGRLLRFLIYVVVGFFCAFLYSYIKK